MLVLRISSKYFRWASWMASFTFLLRARYLFHAWLFRLCFPEPHALFFCLSLKLLVKMICNLVQVNEVCEALYILIHHFVLIWQKSCPLWVIFIRPSRDGPYYVIGYGGRAGVHTGFRTTLVLYIRSLPNLATWFPCGRGRTLFILGSLGQRSRSPLL